MFGGHLGEVNKRGWNSREGPNLSLMASLARVLSLLPFALHVVDDCEATGFVRRVVEAQFELRPNFSHVAQPMKSSL
jgi:hypothetical protein